ncbi:hypothetical protein Rs2_35299 [Raphanus sativus]|nr:hypothetical protein Rs2_35299 [Raphanus sativus]
MNYATWLWMLGKNDVIPPDATTFNYVENRTSDPLCLYIVIEMQVEQIPQYSQYPHSPVNLALARKCKYMKINRKYIDSCTGGKTEDFMAAAKLFHAADRPPSEILDIAEPTGLAESRSDFPSPAVSSSYAGKETLDSENGGVDEDNTLPPSPDNSVTFAEYTEAPTVSSVQTSQPAQSPQQM